MYASQAQREARPQRVVLTFAETEVVRERVRTRRGRPVTVGVSVCHTSAATVSPRLGRDRE